MPDQAHTMQLSSQSSKGQKPKNEVSTYLVCPETSLLSVLVVIFSLSLYALSPTLANLPICVWVFQKWSLSACLSRWIDGLIHMDPVFLKCKMDVGIHLMANNDNVDNRGWCLLSPWCVASWHCMKSLHSFHHLFLKKLWPASMSPFFSIRKKQSKLCCLHIKIHTFVL